MKLRRYFNLNVGLVLVAFLSGDVTAQVLPKGSPVLPNQQSIPPLLAPPTNSLVDGVALTRHVPTAGPLFSAPGSYVSPWLVEIVKLVQAQIDDAVIVTFIDSAGTLNLDAEKIIYLRDLGLSGEMVSIMLQHDGEIASGLRPIPPAPSASPATVHLGATPGLPKVPNSAPSPALSNSAGAQFTSSQSVLAKSSENGGQSGTGPITTSAPDEEAIDLPVVHIRSTPPSTLSPVRQPYAVQLLDPIVVFRSPGRAPNLMVLEMLP
jgi:hypothetical protein